MHKDNMDQSLVRQDCALPVSLISVVICTHNRAGVLKGALETVCLQALDPQYYEIIVVDNNSTDDTRAVTEEFCRRHANVRYCFEGQQGLSYARNRGWQTARGDYVAYIDDDCRVPHQWLTVAKHIIDDVSPAVFGGPYYAAYNSPKPRWFKDSYGSHEPGREARILRPGEYTDIFGGNAFFRRQLLQRLGGFDPRLGMSGRKLGYGEETALLRYIGTNMPEQIAYYDPALYVYHLVQPKKMTIRWTMRRRFVQGAQTYRAFHSGTSHAIGDFHPWKAAARTLVRFAVDLTYGVLTRDRRRYPYIQNYHYERTSQHLAKLGRLCERCRQTRQTPERHLDRLTQVQDAQSDERCCRSTEVLSPDKSDE